MQLRPYQQKLIDETRMHLRDGKKVLIVSPTAGGKTATLSHMIATASQRDFSSFFVVHKRELLRQVIDAFMEADIDFGVIAAGYPEQKKRVQIVMIQSLARRVFETPDLIVIDEAHRSTAKSYDKLFQLEAFIIGLSATPQRTDGRGLADRFDVIVESPDVAALRDAGYIAPFKYYAPSSISMKGVKKQGGDYVAADIEKVFEKSTIVGDSVRDYKELTSGKRMLVFCYSVKHAKDVCERFRQGRVPAAHLDGGMPDLQREYILNSFKLGDTKVIASCDLLLEGIDIRNVEVIDQQRPTDSLIVFMQLIGRGFRLFPGKTHLIIFDRVGNYLRHGLPDAPRVWSLDSKPKRKSKVKSIPTRRCKECFAVSPGGTSHCVDCHIAFPIEPVTVREVGGELKELTIFEKKEKRMEVGKAKTRAELEHIAKERGYKPGWIWQQMRLKRI